MAIVAWLPILAYAALLKFVETADVDRTGMTEARLPTEVWVMAQIRTGHADGMPAYVVRRGERMGGTVLVKLNLLGPGYRVLTQVRGPNGKLAWMSALGAEPRPEAEVEAYIAKAVSRDPDLWVIEVEHREGRHPFEGAEL